MSISAATDPETLAALADVLIPAAEGMPSASEAGATGPLLDEVLRVRGDLQEPLAKLTADAANKDPRAEVDRLKADEPELFEPRDDPRRVPLRGPVSQSAYLVDDRLGRAGSGRDAPR